MAKIDIIDDDVVMVSLLETLLTIEGHQVSKTNPSAEKNIADRVANFSPDIIILDVFMREKNGLDILRQLRQDERFNRVKVIMTSGMDIREQCLQEGANGFLVKPYMPEELIQYIRDQMLT